jgi:hypothetical protein
MMTFLNITLLVVGTAATLCAFGGETWRKGKEPIFERITVRGWISLMCLLLALSLGVIKEIEAKRDEAKKDADAKQEKAQAAVDKAELAAALAKSQAELTVANGSLQLLRQELGDAQSTLGNVNEDLEDTKGTLKDVRSELTTAESDLASARQQNLITGLGTRRVTQIWFFAPILPSGPQDFDIAKVIGSALDEVSSCTPSNDLLTAFHTSGAAKDSVGETYGEGYGRHDPHKHERRSGMAFPGGSIDEAILHWNHPWDKGVNVYVAKYILSQPQPAADFARSIGVDSSPFTMQDPFDLQGIDPKRCPHKPIRDKSSVFSSADILFVLEDNANQTLVIHLTAEAPRMLRPFNQRVMSFRVVSPPSLRDTPFILHDIQERFDRPASATQ